VTGACAYCRRAPCVCDRDAGDEHAAADVDDELDVYAELRRREALDRAEYWLRPCPPPERT
jgi:hypothetical protein